MQARAWLTAIQETLVGIRCELMSWCSISTGKTRDELSVNTSPGYAVTVSHGSCLHGDATLFMEPVQRVWMPARGGCSD